MRNKPSQSFWDSPKPHVDLGWVSCSILQCVAVTSVTYLQLPPPGSQMLRQRLMAASVQVTHHWHLQDAIFTLQPDFHPRAFSFICHLWVVSFFVCVCEKGNTSSAKIPFLNQFYSATSIQIYFKLHSKVLDWTNYNLIIFVLELSLLKDT